MPLFQPFVYEKDNFVQADSLYQTDVAILLNRTEKKIYLWAGKRAGKDTLAEAELAWTKFTEKYADFNPINLITKKELTDFELAREIRALIGQHADEDIAEQAKNKYNKAAKISVLIGIFFIFIVICQALIFLVFPIQGDILVISEANFARFFDSALILLCIVEGAFVSALFFAVWGKNARLAVPSLLSLFVGVGLWLYLAQRDYLFYFQDYGAIPGIVKISGGQIAIFMGILLVILLGVFLLYFIADRSRPKAKKSSGVLSSNQDSIPEIPSKNSA